MKKLALSVITLALAVAQAASAIKVELSSPMTVAGTELKAGAYKVQVDGGMVTFKSDKKTVTVPGTMQKGTETFRNTMMESEGSTLKAIRVGGTDTSIMFATTTAATGAH